MTRARGAARRAARPGLIAAFVLLGLASCAKTTHAPDVTAPRPGVLVDSATVALWHMDDGGGTRAADSGPYHLDAIAGLDTRSIFGRFGSARLFTYSTDSFLYVPWNDALDLSGPLTIEAWVAPNSYSPYEDAVIAARWSPSTTAQSWVFSIVGTDSMLLGPHLHQAYVHGALTGQLMFLYQPEHAGSPRVFFSLSSVPLQRWTQVAVTFDGQVVTFWMDGREDGTSASTELIRSTDAPLLVGNFFDTRFLTEFGGDLRQPSEADPTAWYAFDGGIDELRISNVARTRFSLSAGR